MTFEQGMKRAAQTAETAAGRIKKAWAGHNFGFADALKGFAAAFTVGVLSNVIKNALEYAGSLGEVSQQLGVTTRDLQVFRFAAGQVGVSQEQLETGLSKLTITLGKVAAGAKAPAAALKAIGVSADQIKGKDTGEAFRIIADGLQKVTDRSQRAAVEVALFGKSGAQLDNLLAGGSSAINELATAADKLGIVLSDEQIQKADETADKLEAVKTVLSAKIAGVVADNADAILGLANALAAIVTAAGDAVRALGAFYKYAAQARDMASEQAQRVPAFADALVKGATAVNPALGAALAFMSGGSGKPKASTPKLPPPPVIKPSGGDIGKFLAGGGGGGKKHKGGGRADHSAEDALRDQNRFDQDIRRANIDILNAKKNLATDAVEQYQISIDIKDAEKAAFEAQLAYEVKLNQLSKGQDGITEAQARELSAKNAIVDQLERDKLKADEDHRAFEESAQLDNLQFDLQRDRLESEQQLAETASEQRAIQLRLLDLAYEQERARLKTIEADTTISEAAREEARQRLLNLDKTYANDRQGVINSTRGPMEDYLASLPTTAAKAQEALERLEVQGFEGLIDASLALSDGFKSAKDALLQTLKDFLLGLARMNMQRGLAGFLQGSGGNFLGSLFGGGSSAASGFTASLGSFGIQTDAGSILGFASGGGFSITGRHGVDKNVMSINGLPIARVSRGERVSISNDNDGSYGMRGRGDTVMNIYTPDADSFRRTEGQITRQWKRRMATT